MVGTESYFLFLIKALVKIGRKKILNFGEILIERLNIQRKNSKKYFKGSNKNKVISPLKNYRCLKIFTIGIIFH